MSSQMGTFHLSEVPTTARGSHPFPLGQRDVGTQLQNQERSPNPQRFTPKPHNAMFSTAFPLPTGGNIAPNLSLSLDQGGEGNVGWSKPGPASSSNTCDMLSIPPTGLTCLKLDLAGIFLVKSPLEKDGSTLSILIPQEEGVSGQLGARQWLGQKKPQNTLLLFGSRIQLGSAEVWVAKGTPFFGDLFSVTQSDRNHHCSSWGSPGWLRLDKDFKKGNGTNGV